MRPAGQHRRRQAQLLSSYSSSFCNFSGKNISFVRTPFSVSSLLLISVTVPVSLLGIVTDDTSPLLYIYIADIAYLPVRPWSSLPHFICFIG